MSWTYPSTLLSENIFTNEGTTEGFTTRSVIALNVSRNTKTFNVVCYASCGDFTVVSKTLQLKARFKGSHLPVLYFACRPTHVCFSSEFAYLLNFTSKVKSTNALCKLCQFIKILFCLCLKITKILLSQYYTKQNFRSFNLELYI